MRTLKKVFFIAGVLVGGCVFTVAAQQPKPQPPKAGEDTKGKVFVSVETSPSFPGGLDGFGKYLSSSIKYPTVDKQNKVTGKVFVTFVVQTDGSISDVAALRGPSATLKAEAIRVMKASPKWKPGIQEGKPVRVQYTVPINFTLASNVTDEKSKAGPPPPPQPPKQQKNNVFVSVETSPSFPGGISEFGKYLSSTIKYPAIDKQNKITGKVFVTFVVETDGSISDVAVLRGPSETLKAEAIRVMKTSPKWKPGIQDGKPVRVQYTVPINFTLG